LYALYIRGTQVIAAAVREAKEEIGVFETAACSDTGNRLIF
jgi:hypothetical protein